MEGEDVPLTIALRRLGLARHLAVRDHALAAACGSFRTYVLATIRSWPLAVETSFNLPVSHFVFCSLSFLESSHYVWRRDQNK